LLRDGLILNPQLLRALARAGHRDLIYVADSGLPVPPGVEVIDLSLRCGIPSFLEVFDCVRQTLVFESVILARETGQQPIYAELRPRLHGIDVVEVSHEELKRRTADALAVVRTGECTPYANIAMVSGVTF